MVPRLLVLAAVLLLAPMARAAGPPAVLPGVSFQDQDGRMLDLNALRGHVVVIVYGRRSGIEQHVAWGKRLDADLRGRGLYRAEDPPRSRPVQILALAQMGGIPEAFRSMLRGAIRPHVQRGHSLWLDWTDQMSALFGARDPASTVVVADGQGAVRLVVSGPPEGDAYRAVSELVLRLL